MRDVLPPNIENLSLFITYKVISPNFHDGYARLLANAASDMPLKMVCLKYLAGGEGTGLPFNTTHVR
jgi:hypothetical protein